MMFLTEAEAWERLCTDLVVPHGMERWAEDCRVSDVEIIYQVTTLLKGQVQDRSLYIVKKLTDTGRLNVFCLRPTAIFNAPVESGYLL